MIKTVEYIELRALRVLRGENPRPLQEKTMAQCPEMAFRLSGLACDAERFYTPLHSAASGERMDEYGERRF